MVALIIAIATLPCAAQERGYLGVELQDLDAERAHQLGQALGRDAVRGVLVVNPRRGGSPAEQAGMLAGDIILALDDMPMESMAAAVDHIGSRAPGTRLKIQIWRDGEQRDLIATLGRFPEAVASLAAAAQELATLNQEEVFVLQQRLRDAGCYTAAINGIVGPELAAAVKACPSQDPILRIETGMHTASIRRIAVDAQCSLAATGSQDKTVRLWSLPTGQLLRTQRLPIGDGDLGKIWPVAVSPDGKRVAAGGWDALYGVGDPNRRHAIYLFDSATGAQVRHIGSFGNVLFHLAFSPDGKRLAVSLYGTEGVRVLDVETGAELMADRDYKDDSYGVAFGPDGALYAVGWDGFVRRYGPDLKRTAKVETPGGKQPYSVAVHPQGKRIAVGYSDTAAVDILDAKTLQRLVAADVNGVDKDLFSVAWSSDGKRLVAGGQFSKLLDGVWRRPVRIWDGDGRQLGADIPLADSTILSLTPCGDAIAFGAADPSFGLLRGDSTVAVLGKSPVPDMRDKLGDSFTVSTDGLRLRFGLEYGLGSPSRA